MTQLRERSSTVAPDAATAVNVAAYLPEMARKHPDQRAIVWRAGRDYSHWTFRQLDEEVDRYAHGLERIGITRGTRTILMVRPSAEFFALTFALYKVGAVPVLIDPGMGRSRMADCLRAVGAEAFIGIPIAHLLRVMNPGAFRTVRICVTVGRRWGWGGHRLIAVRESGPPRTYNMAPTHEDDPAAIIFTTGSTGPPKGVLYSHGKFAAQVHMLRDHFGIRPGEIDLPTFPLFALFDPALGVTAVIPEMDFTRPAWVDPTKIIGAIRDQQVTHIFGSPALLDRVGRFGEEHGVKLPTLRRVISAGAAVPPDTIRRFSKMFVADAQIHTPYGATEALPVASIASREILDIAADPASVGKGTCVGRPIRGMNVRIIRISDEPIERWSDDLVRPNGEIGEIAVTGPVVTREYCTDPVATRLAKINDANGLWHRMGDVGWMDEQGRLWFCGRKAHRVVTATATMFTEPWESLFNSLPGIRRTALVGVGEPPNQIPVLCIEPEREEAMTDELGKELIRIAGEGKLPGHIAEYQVHYGFPVDIRHNSKIFREKLAIRAAERLS